MAHPDYEEATEWVSAEVHRPRALSYEELRGDLNAPTRYPIDSRIGRVPTDESQVSMRKERDPLRVPFAVCEPRPGIVRSIVSDDFIRTANGSFLAESRFTGWR
jgi:hypothetical protein